MPLSLTSKTYPLAPNAIVTNLIPDGDTGFVGLTTLDAHMVASDPANHFCGDVSDILGFYTEAGGKFVALAFTRDGGKTYEALPILIRTASDDPQYPYGLPVGGLISKNPPQHLNYQFAWFFSTETFPLSDCALLRDPQSGSLRFYGGAGNDSQSPAYWWEAQGDGKTAECWVTTRPVVGKTLPSPGISISAGYRFFSPYDPKSTVYPQWAFGGSPTQPFIGAETVYWRNAQGHSSQGITFITAANDHGTYTRNAGAFQQSVGFLQGAAQHSQEPHHVIRGNPGGRGGFAQSFDMGATTTKIYSVGIADYNLNEFPGYYGEIFILNPPGDLFPLNNTLFFEGDAIYSFGAWGFTVSRDGGQTWLGETINGAQYAFNLLHAKGGGYFPDSALLDTGKLQLPPPYAFANINIATSPNSGDTRFFIARNSAPDPANPGGRVNGVQAFQGPTTSSNPNDGTATFLQQQFSQTANFNGVFWHAVCLMNNSRIGDTGPQVCRWILLHSQDLGATWEQLPEPPQITYGMHLTVDRRTGWLHWGLQYTSRDAGQTWTAK